MVRVQTPRPVTHTNTHTQTHRNGSDIMSLDDLNEAADRSGGKWVNLNVEGQTLEGYLVASESRGKTFEGKPTYTKATMDNPDPAKRVQRTEVILALETPERDADDANDDGLRKLTLDEGGQMAMGKAKRELGRKFEIGDYLKFRCTKSSVQGKHGPDIEAKVVVEKCRGANPATADAINSDDW